MKEYELTDKEIADAIWDAHIRLNERNGTIIHAAQKKLLEYLRANCDIRKHRGYLFPRGECINCWKSLYKDFGVS